MEEEARQVAGNCESVRERGINIFYNTTPLSLDRTEAYTAIVARWLSTSNIQQVKTCD